MSKIKDCHFSYINKENLTDAELSLLFLECPTDLFESYRGGKLTKEHYVEIKKSKKHQI